MSKFTSQFIIPCSPGGCVSISVSAACVPLVTTQSLHSSSQARVHHRGPASATPPLLLLVTALELDEDRCLGWAGVRWLVAGVCRVSRLHAPLPLCCCNLVSWSPTDCSLRPEAAAESSQLLPPPAALQHGRSCHELHSEAANPITHNLAVPSIGAKSETRQGKYNRLNYFYGCSCGRNYSERMPRCFGGVL